MTVGALGWSILENILLLKLYPCYANPTLENQMADDWTTTYCINEDGFPRVLYAATVRLGIPERPYYVGREFVEHGTESCEVTIHIGASDKYLEMQPWSVTATEPVCLTPFSLEPARRCGTCARCLNGTWVPPP